MFKRKLSALDYANPDAINENINYSRKARAMVLWLEDQKIRHYKIEDRANLRNIDSPEWNDAYETYLKELGCPPEFDTMLEQLEWLIGYGIKLEYADNPEKFKIQTSQNIQKTMKNVPKQVYTNPLDNMDFDSEEFKKGVNALAKAVNVTPHPDHLVTLEAVGKVICERMNPECIEKPELVVPQGKPFPVMETDSGFDMGEALANEAAKILRLLYIHDLRSLQTKINECIVAVQKVTANPKTDTKLGKVGF